jgi:hypothetical protein
MPSFSLLRSIRRSRWRTRLAAGAVAAGVLAGPLVASPAEAHGPGVHYVTITGWAKTSSGDALHPTRCSTTYSATLTLQRGVKDADRVDIVKDCGAHRVSVVLNARLRDDKYVDTDGDIKVKTQTCWVFLLPCVWSNGTPKPFRATIAEDFTQTMPEPVSVGASGVTATFSFKIIVDGPDAPVM